MACARGKVGLQYVFAAGHGTDVAALAREFQAAGPPDPRAGAGHQRHRVFDVGLVRHLRVVMWVMWVLLSVCVFVSGMAPLLGL